MKVSIDWLRTYVDTNLPPTEIADRLTMSGLEVEDIEQIGSNFEGVVVGEVREVRRHPNADRLTVCAVDVGAEEPLHIVCGAPNVAAGQKVPVATIGTTLSTAPRHPDEQLETLLINRQNIRGEVSEGMICSSAELGLSDDHSGIMELDPAAVPGSSFREYLDERGAPPSDSVLDVAITPNRPDATSHFGVARDVAALSGGAFRRPDVSSPEAAPAGPVPIEIHAPEACGRYVGIVLRGVTISESPDWLKRKLTSIGLRPRNNVVDVTNFVMYECGQPLHAFDLQALAGPAIHVRLSTGGETFTTLDDRKHALPAGTLLICDAEKPVALAGVMGGANSEVTDLTTDLLIESAYFDPSTVRRAAKALSIQTDSSYRFERGVDSDGQLWAAARAAELILKLAGGEIEPPAIDVHPAPLRRRTVDVRVSRVRSLLGIELEASRIRQLLEAIGFHIDGKDGVLHCTVPTFRPDVEREVDVIEEIVRLHGFDRIPEPERSVIPNVVPADDSGDTLARSVRERLAGLGYHEVHTNSMLRTETAERFNRPPLVLNPEQTVVETLNPISREMASLRPSLLPGVLQVITHNWKHGQRGLRFFEFGHVFGRIDDSDNLVDGYRERDHLLIAAAGPIVEAGWSQEVRQADLFDVKGLVENLFAYLAIDGVTMLPHSGRSEVAEYALEIAHHDQPIGTVGRLAEALQNGYEIGGPVFFAEIDWQYISGQIPRHRRFQPVARFPVVERDIALIVSRELPAAAIIDTIRDAGQPLLQDVHLFDLYEGEGISEGNRSLAFSLRFGTDRTLTDREVDERMDAITARLEDVYGARLRR